MMQPKGKRDAAGGDLRQRQAKKDSPTQHQMRADQRANERKDGATEQGGKKQERRTENIKEAYHG
jgi:hypothetical protein